MCSKAVNLFFLLAFFQALETLDKQIGLNLGQQKIRLRTQKTKKSISLHGDPGSPCSPSGPGSPGDPVNPGGPETIGPGTPGSPLGPIEPGGPRQPGGPLVATP